jgi:hypothetical protein
MPSSDRFGISRKRVASFGARTPGLGRDSRFANTTVAVTC